MAAGGPSASFGPSRAQASLLARVVALIGLAFFLVELAVLAVFTGGYWVWLTNHREDAVATHASRVREHVRRALHERAHPPDEVDVNAQLDAAVRSGRGQASAEGGPLPANLEPDAPIDTWVLTRGGDVFRLVGGQLVAAEADEWPGSRWPDVVRRRVDELFLGREVAAFYQVELPVEAVLSRALARAEPIVTAGHGQPDAVLWLESSLRDLQRQVATYGLVAFGSGAVALFITAMVVMHYLRRALLLPLSRLIAADNAARRGDEAHAVIDEGDIPDDEVGAIMRSRNLLFLALLKGRRDLDEKNGILVKQGEELRAWGEQLERLVEQKSSALLRARDRLHRTEKLAALGRLAANVAHEINNPLASIAGHAEEARDQLGGAADPEVARALETIEEQAFRCKEILKRLLGLARSDQVELSDVALRRLARESVRLAESARRRGVEVRVDDAPAGDRDPDGPTVKSDAASLQQVILNLVENAIDAAASDASGARGGARGDERAGQLRPGPWVRVSVQRAEAEALVVVRDSGRGVPAALRERVFDPFYTTKPVGRGTGLGLAISQSLVERLGGRLTIDDDPQGGAAFTVHLPRRPAAASARAPRVAGAPVDASDLVEAQLDARGMSAADPDA